MDQRDDYQRVARSGQVPDGIVRRFYVGEVEIAVARWDGRVHAMSNYCTHLDCLLSSGHATEDGLLCSCHGSVFDYESGEPIQPPATRPIRVYAVREVDGEILVRLPPDATDDRPRRRQTGVTG
ncbi:Rieske 2Fe-2S domain-containing protein [Nonomuraea sp. NPDC048916]|uniref:Rieske (2Fe-2S) protein n=1 Tax=Nonomuraea sp. NPDC048916 TaxID=3154232 RepID=UPI0033E61B0A